MREVPEQAFGEGFHVFPRAVAPWTALVDQKKFDGVLEIIQRFQATPL
jgi:hypothetical protein